MTPRIKELAEQAGFRSNVTVTDGNNKRIDTKTSIALEKFAELIVRETIKQMAIQMDKFGDDQSNNPAWYKSEEAVKKHFGVEE